MNRLLKVLSLISILAIFAACKSDDDKVSLVPKRNYQVQYNTEKALIEQYLKTHYMTVDEETWDVAIDTLLPDSDKMSIWDQQEYPLVKDKLVYSNDVVYTLYYIKFAEGVGERPTRGDNVLTSYRGFDINGTQFDYVPYPEIFFPMPILVEAWQEIMPLFKTGIYVDEPGSPDPARYEGYGAGIMFVPSGLAYYNAPPSGSTLKEYTPVIFSFKLYDLEYTDFDADGVLNKYETEQGIDVELITDKKAIEEGMLDIKYHDTDNDGFPNYLDSDDDGDGYKTLTEITDPDTDEIYEIIPGCSKASTLPLHLDSACHKKTW